MKKKQTNINLSMVVESLQLDAQLEVDGGGLFYKLYKTAAFKFHIDIQRLSLPVPAQQTLKSFPQAKDIQCMLICILSI